MSYQHAELAAGRWRTVSLMEQLGNIGSEVERAIKWRSTDKQWQKYFLYFGIAARQ